MTGLEKNFPWTLRERMKDLPEISTFQSWARTIQRNRWILHLHTNHSTIKLRRSLLTNWVLCEFTYYFNLKTLHFRT